MLSFRRKSNKNRSVVDNLFKLQPDLRSWGVVDSCPDRATTN